MQEKVKFVPKTNTVNQDRQYFLQGDTFIKVDTIVERGRNEAKILSSLDHPYIQKYIRSYEKEGLHYLETEYFRGQSLEYTTLTVDQQKVVQSQLLQVLAYLTLEYVTHQDINVSNVLFNGEKILLIDWETAGHGNPLGDISGIKRCNIL